MIDCMKDCKYAQCSAGCKHWQSQLAAAEERIKRLRGVLDAIIKYHYHNDMGVKPKVYHEAIKLLKEKP